MLTYLYHNHYKLRLLFKHNVVMETTEKTLEREFELFLNNMEKENITVAEMRGICEPLTKLYRKQQFKKKLKKVLLLAVVLLLLYAIIKYCVECQWFLTALGRLFLIQLLPYWDWTSLYNKKCLIEWTGSREGNEEPTSTVFVSDYETLFENCLLCKFVDNIALKNNVTFSHIQHYYLERGLPVIVLDSHAPQDFSQLLTNAFTRAEKFLHTTPCDLLTNLILRNFFNTEVALRTAQDLLDTEEKWFLQLRNCQFEALKSCRALIKKPYFYPIHFPPYYSSWLLLSQNYDSEEYYSILVEGLIIIQQLFGDVDILLTPKSPCEGQCPELNILLKAGESLLFTTDVWLISYKFISQPLASVTTIVEIAWN